MKEFSSYYYVKANETPLDTYMDIAYFESSRVSEKSFKHLSLATVKVCSKFSEISSMVHSHE